MLAKIINHLCLVSIIGLFWVNASWTKTIQLYKINLTAPELSERNEGAELRNAESPNAELVVTGNTTAVHVIPGESTKIYLVVTTYKADKNGYHAGFNITAVNYPTTRLGAATLKILTG